MPTDVEQDIGRTIRFFSYFGYPLTAFEVWKWLYRPSRSYTFLEIDAALASFDSFHGCYGIATGGFGDVATQVRTRHNRFLNAIEKYRKLQRAWYYLSALPGVKGLAICNTLAIHHTRENSDMDLFVITEHGRVWSTRFFAVLPFLLLRQRPKEAKKNPVDISFFLSESDLNIMWLKLGDEDPYLSWWVRSIVPIFGREEVYQAFVRHNAWAKLDFPNSLMPKRAGWLRSNQSIPRSILRVLRVIPEHWLKWLQEKKFPKDIRDSMNVDGRVVVTDTMLKFHKNDRRGEILRHLYETHS